MQCTHLYTLCLLSRPRAYHHRFRSRQIEQAADTVSMAVFGKTKQSNSTHLKIPESSPHSSSRLPGSEYGHLEGRDEKSVFACTEQIASLFSAVKTY